MAVIGDGWLFAELDANLRHGIDAGRRRTLLRLRRDGEHGWDEEDAAWTALVCWLTALNQVTWLPEVALPAPAPFVEAAPRALRATEVDEAAILGERLAAVDVVCATPSLRRAHDDNVEHAAARGAPASQRDARLLWGTAGMLARAAVSGGAMAPHPARLHLLDVARPAADGATHTVSVADAAVDALLAATDADRLLRTADEARDAVVDERARLGAWIEAVAADDAEAAELSRSLDAPGERTARVAIRTLAWERAPFEGEDVEPGRRVERRAMVVAVTHRASEVGRDAVERWLEAFDIARTSLGERVRQRYARVAEIRAWRQLDAPVAQGDDND